MTDSVLVAVTDLCYLHVALTAIGCRQIPWSKLNHFVFVLKVLRLEAKQVKYLYFVWCQCVCHYYLVLHLY